MDRVCRFVYYRHIMASPRFRALRRFGPYHIEIQFLGYNYVADGGRPRAGNPYWRLFWAVEGGMMLASGRQRAAVGDTAAVLIAPQTPFAVRLANPVHHVYVFFSLGGPFERVAPGLHAFSLPAGLTRRWRRVLADEDPRVGGRMQLLLMQVIGRGMEAVPEAAWPAWEGDPRLEVALHLLRQNLQAPLPNATVAAACHLSVGGFVRLFSQTMGCPPQHYRLQVRLTHACNLLLHSSASVEAIAEQCGFSDRFHLTRLLRKHMHITPGAYRRQQAGRGVGAAS